MSLLHCYSLILGIFLSHSLFGQHKIKGLVYDESHSPLQSAHVLLYSQPDSLTSEGSVTNSTGMYEFNRPKAGLYYLFISMVGFESQNILFEFYDTTKTISPVYLKRSSLMLKEVQVVANKNLINVENGKVIYNVVHSSLASGLNLLELLDKIPGIRVDKISQSISLLGKQGLLILIDGRQTYLTQDLLANWLRTLRADDIEKIEVSQNPSSKYDAAGSGGLINIITKQAKNYGTQYNLLIGGGYSYYEDRGSTPKADLSLTAQHRSKKLSWLVSGSLNRYSWSQITKTNNFLLDSASQNLIEKRLTNEIGRGFGMIASGRMGANYSINESTIISTELKLSSDNNEFRRYMTQNNYQDNVNETILTQRFTDNKNVNISGSLTLKKKYNKEGQEWSTDVDMVSVHDNSNSLYSNQKFIDQSNTNLTNNFTEMSTLTNIIAVKSDYIQPIGNNIKIELGVKSSVVTNHSVYSTDFVPNSIKQLFKYRETISGIYTNVAGSFGKRFQIQTGIRVEHTNSEGIDAKDNILVNYNYFNIFPSANFTVKTGENRQLTLSYGRRIERPSYLDLSPFLRFSSTQQFYEGNPRLLPRLNHSFSLNQTLTKQITVGLQYELFNQITLNVPSTENHLIPGYILIRNKQVNVPNGRFQWFGGNLNYQKEVNKIWSTSMNLSVMNSINKFSLNGTQIHNNLLFISFYASNSFSLSQTLSGEITGYYYSPQVYGYDMIHSQGAINFGLSKILLEKRALLKVVLDDPFNILRNAITQTTATVQSISNARWDNRQLRVTFSYKFGNLNAKANLQSKETVDINRIQKSK
ncbi:outer membrane beta-barrel protein [Spirosoma endophyticum]|uniref:CarboxypepD_reg-like domain-containing protein n=1 Tax=Spirosoma endophyticum TaxID=662367 RepID=A0A1I2BKG5_9BACT|nr:outer membrane beta-barrel protein [Spirosoma endophyticum]SFE56288.1 CarboxypepD_reg-like domain-containing protein [Spirosoma endophyticum]